MKGEREEERRGTCHLNYYGQKVIKGNIDRARANWKYSLERCHGRVRAREAAIGEPRRRWSLQNGMSSHFPLRRHNGSPLAIGTVNLLANIPPYLDSNDRRSLKVSTRRGTAALHSKPIFARRLPSYWPMAPDEQRKKKGSTDKRDSCIPKGNGTWADGQRNVQVGNCLGCLPIM